MDTLSLKQVRVLDAVARTRGIGPAAEILNTSQSVVSRTVAAAEDALGRAIFQRGWSGSDPTAFGSIVLDRCARGRAAIAQAEAAFAAEGIRANLAPHLKWSQLDAIAAVVRHGSTLSAATDLGVSQPAISRTLSAVNGFCPPLFQRRRDGLEATAAARRLAELGELLRREIGTLAEMLAERPGLERGRLAVGMLPFSGQDLVARAFGRLTHSHPGLRLMAIPGSYAMLTDALMRGEIDCLMGILRRPPKIAALEERFLYHERYALVARADHPCHDAPQTMTTLRDQTWMVAQHGTPIRSYFERLYAAEGTPPPTQTCEIHSFVQAEAVVIHSESVGLLAYSRDHLAGLDARLKQVAIDLPDAEVEIGLTTRRGADVRMIDAFRGALRPDLPQTVG
ncbi:LysR family transcriptional regulator [Pseudoprimorskyibacter insulae]|uniref:HTH-type transcriptional regulator GbpR n=1 Tax=Pseudoprimorskyibacter insulae TaxID=1695997 RepID=A0A2R8AW08_9RHOB|nr:LysR family transcriptional regulator [Pseudoprimorskyibacter insulae]SPF80215.1 HTH-type transcriptional regulator GbpR [Pseudoprimorskyibacter insulae]